MSKKLMPFTYHRELFKLKDGGTIGLDWLDSYHEIAESNQPIVAIMPGLSSDSDEIYIINIVLEAKKAGFRPVVINYRGASGVPLTVRNFT
jgi:uncharacterized protein